MVDQRTVQTVKVSCDEPWMSLVTRITVLASWRTVLANGQCVD